MPIKVIVRDETGVESQLVFDGTQRVVIGRGPGCEVRLPDASVSHRHAVLLAKGADFAIVDEGSSNGTWIGGVRVAPRTSRLVRSGDRVRLGRVWIELRIDQGPVTRDVAAATRDLALRMLSRELEARGVDLTTRVRVVEGPDQGASLALAQEDKGYVVGRGPQCDLPLADGDASREHAVVVRRGGQVAIRDRGAKNGTWLAGVRIPPMGEVEWRASQEVQLGCSVLALEEPLGNALAQLEAAPDEPFAETVAAPPEPAAASPVVDDATSPGTTDGEGDAPAAATAPASIARVTEAAPERAQPQPSKRWAVSEVLVFVVAGALLLACLATLLWILR